MLIRCIALLVVIFILSPGAPALAAELGNGVIEGKIVNGTENGSSVAGLIITLQIYLGDAEAGSNTTSTNADGQFVFDGLSTVPRYSYQAVVTFQGAEYHSQRLSFEPGGAVRSAEVTVYDSTTSDAIIRLEISRTVLYLEQDSLLVKEYMLFTNGTDRTYIGSGESTAYGTRETLRFLLPREAVELQPETGLMNVYGSDGGFADTMPVFPGVREVAYSYKIDFSTEAYEFVKKVNYPIATYNFLAQEKGIEIASDQLTIEEPIYMKDTWFNRLSGKDIASGDIIVIQLVAIPQTNPLWIIMGITLALMVLTAGLIFGYRMRRRRLGPGQPRAQTEETGEEGNEGKATRRGRV